LLEVNTCCLEIYCYEFSDVSFLERYYINKPFAVRPYDVIQKEGEPTQNEKGPRPMNSLNIFMKENMI
jgi:hypothetical protein